ncbi:hydantoinase B/oxoprolinase family protein [Burkholderia thailandensis]|uniref:hydantoinase B/oxoprolinase family protein n=1 Tax=Burkholderia thailandensis TaxID=57975 RepID=UPI002D798F75|nr:hydantoinase B/oxoprolinase family protein [Burkholderia thailandensis]WRS69941.1 hydantoinase B/oxoprolinase family protein [Burkholderia thailandensis]
MEITMRNASAFTSEIIQNSLQAVAAEMFDAMRVTAMSPIIYEVLDMGTGILNAKGEMASSGAGIPVLVGVVDKAVRRFVEIYDKPGEIEPGDVFITNDPAYGGVTHLNDIVLAMPVFAGDRLVAWTANSAHWNDVGGKVPGSMAIDATEIYQEGLRLPAVKLISKGNTLRSVVDIIKANSRMPDFAEGDMWAGVAAVRSGEKRLTEIIEKYGCEAFERALEESMTLAEQISLRALRKLPQGRFELEEPQDDGKIYRVSIDVRDDAMIVDLRDNPDSVNGPGNICRDATEIAAQMVFKSITDSSSPANGGTFRPLQVLTRPGSIFDALSPAAEGFYFETLIRVHDLILRCIAQHCPQLVCAGTFSSNCVTFIGGTHPDTERQFTLVEPELGGWGATHDADGNHATFSPIHGDTFNCPVEIAEIRYGVYVDKLELNLEPGGEGQFRGGCGVVLEYRVREDGASMTCGYSRSKIRPWGLEGGNEGTGNRVELIRADGTTTRHAFESNIRMNKGDVARVVTGNGAGYGDPRKRSHEAIRRDLRDGLTTPERAAQVYGFQP